VIFALKNLRRRIVRTSLAVLGVGVAVASIVAFTAMAHGLKESLNEYARQSGADLIVYDKSVPDPSWSRVKQAEQEELRRIENVADVSASSAKPALVPGMPAILVLGRVPGEKLMEFYERCLVEGRGLRDTNETILGTIAARELKKKPGDTLFVLGRKFAIVGIYETRVTFENGGMIVHMEALRKDLHETDVGMAFYVFLGDSGRREKTAREIERRVPRFRAVPALDVLMNFDQVKYIDNFVWIISVAALAVGAIGVLNTLLMSISERVREIGTLRAFGWSRARVMRMIWTEGLVISVLGGIVGIGLGMGGAELLMRMIPQGFLQTAYTPLTFLKGMAIAVGVGLVGALYPAAWASRLAPAEALRYE
jgi:putative ABC transport system permease protein